MTAEQLHDALTLLPADLIAETDAKRSRKPKVLRWRSFAAMAACFVLLLGCGWFSMTRFGASGATEAAAPEEPMMQAESYKEAAPAETQRSSLTEEAPAAAEAGASDLCGLPTAPAEEETDTAAQGTTGANSVSTRSYSTPDHLNASYNTTTSPENLVLTSRQELEYYLEDHAWRYDFTTLVQDLSRYSEDWFRNHDLLVTVVHASPTGTPWTVTAIQDVRGTDAQGWEWFVHVSHSGQYDPNREITNVHLLTQIEKNTVAPGSAILTVYDTAESSLCDDHSHRAAEPQEEESGAGWCGNMTVTVYVSGEAHTLSGTDAVTLTDILYRLDYREEDLCRCAAAFTVDTEMGTGYALSPGNYFARFEGGQAALTEEQAQAIRDILDRLP